MRTSTEEQQLKQFMTILMVIAMVINVYFVVDAKPLFKPANSNLKVINSSYSTRFFDDFSGRSIDLSKWRVSGDSVDQNDGAIIIMTLTTDAGGTLTSAPFTVNCTNLITITRQVFLQYNNSVFDGEFGITIGSVPTFAVRYANISYSRSPTYRECHGFYLVRKDARPDVVDSELNVSEPVTPIWSGWFNEKITYDPKTGLEEYFINDIKEQSFNVGSMPPSSPQTMTLFFAAGGWYTGHSQIFKNLRVIQE